MKKSLLIFLTASILISQISFLAARSAHAAVPIIETNPEIIVAEGLTSAATEGDFVQTMLEWAWRFTKATLKKQLLDVIVDQTIQWIQGGGKPKFVTDWQGFLETAGKEAVGELAKEVGAGFLCAPMQVSLKLTLFPVQQFSKQATCTLDTITGNIENFYEDFRNGGFIGYQTSLSPQNTFFSANLMLQIEQQDRSAKKALAKINEALSGGGFLSTKKCKKDANGLDIPNTCKVTTPGRFAGDAISKAAGSSIDFILSAEEVGDYAAAIADALINRVITAGVDGLLGANAPDAPDTGYVAAGEPGSCQALQGDARESCLTANQQFGHNFQFTKTNLAKQINTTQTLLQETSAAYDKSIATLTTYIAQLTTLGGQLSGVTECAPLPNGSSNPFRKEDLERLKSNVFNEAASASQGKTDLEKQKGITEQVVDQLTDASEHMSALDETNLDKISEIYNSVAGLLDPTRAVNQREAANAQADELQTKTQANIQEFQTKYNQCTAPVR